MRAILIETGRALFAREDFRNVSLRMIASHANYSPGVVYRHFSNRESLFLAIREAELAPYVDTLETIYAAHDDPFERILAMTERGLEFSTREASTFGLHFLSVMSLAPGAERNDSFDGTPSAGRVHLLHRRSIEAYFAILKRRPVDVDEAVACLAASMIGAVALPGRTLQGALPPKRTIAMALVTALLDYWRALADG